MRPVRKPAWDQAQGRRTERAPVPVRAAALVAAKAQGTKLSGRRVSAERLAEIVAATRKARSQKVRQVRSELLPTITAIQAPRRELAPRDRSRTQYWRGPNASKTWGMVCGPSPEGDGKRDSRLKRLFARLTGAYLPV